MRLILAFALALFALACDENTQKYPCSEGQTSPCECPSGPSFSACTEGSWDPCPCAQEDTPKQDLLEVEEEEVQEDLLEETDLLHPDAQEMDDLAQDTLPNCGSALTTPPEGLTPLAHHDGTAHSHIEAQDWSIADLLLREQPLHEAARFQLEHPSRIHGFAVRFGHLPEDQEEIAAGLYADFGHNGFDFWHFEPLWEGTRCPSSLPEDQWVYYGLHEPLEIQEPGLIYVAHRREPGGPAWLFDATTPTPDCQDTCCEDFDACHSAWNLPELQHLTVGNTPYYFWPGLSLSFELDYMVELYVEVIEEEVVEEKVFLPLPEINPTDRHAWGDYDHDGDDDLLTRGPRLWQNQGNQTFLEVTEESGLADDALAGAGVWGDFDNDGCLDLFLFDDAGTRPSHLLRSTCDGAFEDLTAASGFDDSQSYNDCAGQGYDHLPTHAAAWWDVDNDGLLDLYLANMICWTNNTFYHDTIWHNEGDLTFSQWTGTRGFLAQDDERYAGRATAPIDYDQDGDVDLLVSNYRLHRNLFYENQGNGEVLERSIQANLEGNPSDFEGYLYYGHTIASAWGDLDGDGDFDVVQANLAHPRFFNFSDKTQVLINRGTGRFKDNQGGWETPQGESGLRYQETHSVPVLGDFDNDSDLDLSISAIYDGRPTDFYWGNGDATFSLASYESGIEVENGWGMATADFDNDGDLDLTTRDALYENTLSQKGHWLSLRLVGDLLSNRAAIGATARVYVGDQVLLRYVSGGSGQGCQDSASLHFGLGPSTTITRIEIDFPGGGTQHYPGPFDADQRLWLYESGTITQGFAP